MKNVGGGSVFDRYGCPKLWEFKCEGSPSAAYMTQYERRMLRRLNVAEGTVLHDRGEEVEEDVIWKQVDGCEMRFQRFDLPRWSTDAEGQALARWFGRDALLFG